MTPKPRSVLLTVGGALFLDVAANVLSSPISTWLEEIGLGGVADFVTGRWFPTVVFGGVALTWVLLWKHEQRSNLRASPEAVPETLVPGVPAPPALIRLHPYVSSKVVGLDFGHLWHPLSPAILITASVRNTTGVPLQVADVRGTLNTEFGLCSLPATATNVPRRLEDPSGWYDVAIRQPLTLEMAKVIQGGLGEMGRIVSFDPSSLVWVVEPKDSLMPDADPLPITESECLVRAPVRESDPAKSVVPVAPTFISQLWYSTDGKLRDGAKPSETDAGTAPPEAPPAAPNAVGIAGSLGLLVKPGANSPTPALVQFTTERQPARHIEAGARLSALRFVSPTEAIVREADLPVTVPCGGGEIIVKRFTETGFAIEERSTAGADVRVELTFKPPIDAGESLQAPPPAAGPAIEVRPIKGDDFGLEVTNAGQPGRFEAQIEIQDGHGWLHGPVRPPLPFYCGYWDVSAGPVAELAQGHKDRLILGRRELPDIRLDLATFHMTFFDRARRERAEYGTTSWSLSNETTVAPVFRLRVTISSTPSGRNGPFIRTYEVNGRSAELLTEVRQ